MAQGYNPWAFFMKIINIMINILLYVGSRKCIINSMNVTIKIVIIVNRIKDVYNYIYKNRIWLVKTS